MKITNFTHRIITLLLLLSVFSCRKEEIIVQSLFDLSGALRIR